MAITGHKHANITFADIEGAAKAIYESSLLSMIRDGERWPHQVYYAVGGGGMSPYVIHVPPDQFLWTKAKPGASDCIWIVPGTTP
jgi:hypothetical protein